MYEIKNLCCLYHKSYFVPPRDIRLNSTPYLIMEIPNKRALTTAFNH